MKIFRLSVVSLLLAGAVPAVCAPAPVPVVAAETVWGDVARQAGGPAVSVSSILSAPDTDPHLSEPGPSAGRLVGTASVFVVNGAGFDAWADRLGAVRGSALRVVRVSDIAGWREGENQHFWFDPAVVRKVAAAVAEGVIAVRPEVRAAVEGHLAEFDRAVDVVEAREAALRARFAGLHVAATEPLPGPLTVRLGLVMEEEAFQLSVMNDSEPGPAEVARFEEDLRSGRLKLLIYNRQTMTPASERLLGIAREAGVPCVGLGEMLPAGLDWQGWMMAALSDVERALASGSGRCDAR